MSIHSLSEEVLRITEVLWGGGCFFSPLENRLDAEHTEVQGCSLCFLRCQYAQTSL